MAVRNTTTRWGSVAQLLHWTIVILIIVQFVLGYRTHWATGFKKLSTVVPHKSWGITILALALIRLVWRLANPSPLLPNTLKPWERAAAHVDPLRPVYPAVRHAADGVDRLVRPQLSGELVRPRAAARLRRRRIARSTTAS